MDSGDEQDVPNSQSRKKRYHRHTPRQIQELESYALFSSISFFSLYVSPERSLRSFVLWFGDIRGGAL